MRETDDFGVEVVLREGESITSLLRRFKRKVSKSEILKDYRKHGEFMSPGVKRRKKIKEARARVIKEMRKIEKDATKKEQKRKTYKKRGDDNENSSSNS
jgi:small subunit ribosomal protein S21